MSSVPEQATTLTPTAALDWHQLSVFHNLKTVEKILRNIRSELSLLDKSSMLSVGTMREEAALATWKLQQEVQKALNLAATSNMSDVRASMRSSTFARLQKQWAQTPDGIIDYCVKEVVESCLKECKLLPRDTSTSAGQWRVFPTSMLSVC